MKRNNFLTYSFLCFIMCMACHTSLVKAQVSDTTQLIKTWQVDFQKIYDNFPAEVQTDFQALTETQQEQVEQDTANRQVSFNTNGQVQSQNLGSFIPDTSQWIWINNHSAIQLTRPDGSILVFEVNLLSDIALTLILGENKLYFKAL